MSCNQNRKTIAEADLKPSRILRILYGNMFGRLLLKLLYHPYVSRFVGHFMDSRLSTYMIPRFIKNNKIDMTEYEDVSYRSYNAFFTRKVRPLKRIVDHDTSHLISPCDAKLSVYRINANSVFFIKDSTYTIEDLLCNAELADKYCDGICLIFRLAVDDYHRYCYIDDGTKGKNIKIPGVLHTVQPIALRHYNIYKRNAREYTVLDTEHFGRIVQVEVGAMMVGKIKNHHATHTYIRGEEKGYFEFGGSTIVLLLKKDTVILDPEFEENTKNGMETVVKYGEKIGIKRI